MKSKLFPECKQRIHPVLNKYYYSLTGWYWTPGDIHNPTRKVAAFGVEGGEGGEPKNKQRIKRPKQTWAVRRPIVTKRSTANAKIEKSIPPAMSQRNQHLTYAMLRKPATTFFPSDAFMAFARSFHKCESLRQQHPNNSKQHGALAKIGNMQAGLETFNQTMFPGILPFRYTCKSIAFC